MHTHTQTHMRAYARMHTRLGERETVLLMCKSHKPDPTSHMQPHCKGFGIEAAPEQQGIYICQTHLRPLHTRAVMRIQSGSARSHMMRIPMHIRETTSGGDGLAAVTISLHLIDQSDYW